MGSFTASLKTVGDTRGLPATVRLEEGRLSIVAGDAPIGDWPLRDIGLEPVPRGYRLAAEGEHLIIEMADVDQFAEELARSSKRKGRRKGFSGRKADTSGDGGSPQVETPSRPEPLPDPKPPRRRGLPGASAVTDTASPRPSSSTAGLISRFRTSPGTDEPSEPAVADRSARAGDTDSGAATPLEPGGFGARVVGLLDAVIDATERRWGSLLPDWVFNRAVFLAALVLIALAFVFRGVTSITLLIVGVLALLVGGVSYTDDVMASKLLPGRTTPTHVLVVGVSLLALGIIFGLIS